MQDNRLQNYVELPKSEKDLDENSFFLSVLAWRCESVRLSINKHLNHVLHARAKIGKLDGAKSRNLQYLYHAISNTVRYNLVVEYFEHIFKSVEMC